MPILPCEELGVVSPDSSSPQPLESCWQLLLHLKLILFYFPVTGVLGSLSALDCKLC